LQPIFSRSVIWIDIISLTGLATPGSPALNPAVRFFIWFCSASIAPFSALLMSLADGSPEHEASSKAVPHSITILPAGMMVISRICCPVLPVKGQHEIACDMSVSLSLISAASVVAIVMTIVAFVD
jgi:hypothetical protein